MLLDTYHELRLHSETETKVEASSTTLDPNWVLHDKTHNNTLVGVAGYWTYPTQEKSLLFNNDTKWVGTLTEYGYGTYGNLTRITEQAWDGSAFTSYRTTKRSFYPKDSGDTYLVGLLAGETRYLCPNGTCDDGDNDQLTSQQYLYDQNNWNAQPSTGELTGVRTWICSANGSNVCQNPGSGSRELYSDLTYTYDGYGNVTTETAYKDYGINNAQATGTSSTTTYLYNDGGYHTYKTAETNAANHTTSWLYDYRLSVPTQGTDPNNVVTTASYDVFGRMTKVIRPGDSSNAPTIAINYYDSGVNNTGPYAIRVAKKHSAGLDVRYQFYDGLGQQIQTVTHAWVNNNPRDIVNSVAYDAYGRITQQRAPYDKSRWTGSGSPFHNDLSFPGNVTTATTYDAYGRVTAVTSPTNGEDVTYSYDDDLQTVMHNARNNATTTHYDIWGRVVAVHPPDDPWLRYTYDGADRLTQVEKMTGSNNTFATTTMSYDNAGRKLSMDDMDMGQWQYAYDALGNLTEQIDARGCTTTLIYNDSLINPSCYQEGCRN